MILEFAISLLGPQMGEDIVYAGVYVAVLIWMILPYLMGGMLAVYVICRDVGWRFWNAAGDRLIYGGLIFMLTPAVAQALHG